jgi:BirA family biotin operon repressor/biotin-[acetyl-CoA-carboxylase] ligase
MGERYSKAERCGFDEIIAEYRARCATLGKRVRVVCSESVLEGVAEGIDERGALEVRCGGRLLKVHSGDVIHLRQV